MLTEQELRLIVRKQIKESYGHLSLREQKELEEQFLAGLKGMFGGAKKAAAGAGGALAGAAQKAGGALVGAAQQAAGAVKAKAEVLEQEADKLEATAQKLRTDAQALRGGQLAEAVIRKLRKLEQQR